MIGWKSKAALVQHLIGQCDTGGMKLLDKALVGGVLYALIQKGDERFIAVILIKGYREPGGTEWGYKDMDESCGPNVEDCPERLLAQSTINDGYAPEWRARCRAARAAKAGGAKFAETLKPGDEFMWGEARVKFAGIMVRRGRRILTGISARDGRLYRYPMASIKPVPAP
jgi:hypothetical protein